MVNIKLKGSKSISNRVLVLNFLSKLQTRRSTRLSNLSTCEDIRVMKEALSSLSKFPNKHPKKINLKDSGTALRFLTAVTHILDIQTKLTGSKRLHTRPITPLKKALAKLSQEEGSIEIPGNTSSQFISSLLLISPLFKKGLTLKITGETVSKPYIEMTLHLLKKFGIKSIHNHTFTKIKIPKGQKFSPPKAYNIEPDASSASYLIAFTRLKPSTKLTISNLPKKSIQGDSIFKKLKLPGEINMIDTPDLVPTLAILAAFTEGKTRITNIENLRIKESNRIKALENELKKLGTKVKSGKDFIEITGPTPIKSDHKKSRKIKIKTYNDHRIAMAFGVLKKTILPHLRIQKPSVVRKSYPEFWSDLNKLNRNK